MENSDLLQELINLATKKEIPYTPTQLRKMSEERLEQVMQEYKQKELDAMHKVLVDLALGKFEEIMKSFSFIKQDSTLARKLQDQKLFRHDLKNIIASFTPFLPYVGLLEGVVTTGVEIFDHLSDNKNEDSSSKTAQGKESHQTCSATDSDPE